MRIAVLGLGTMGGAMAANLIRAGHDVIVHNRTREREQALAELGAKRAESPKAAAQEAEVVLVCVSDTPDVEQVLLDANDGVIQSFAPGNLVIDCSTIDPDRSRQIAAKLGEQNIGFVDAPVSGGSEGAIHGTLAIMCGGTEDDFARAKPVLEVIGGSITHVGPVGCGQIAKAVNQVIISGTYQTVAEGLVLAARAGADPNKVVKAIENGAAGSWILSNRAENMITNHYPLGFRVRLHRKDLGIALDTARRAGVAMPVASYVATIEDGLISQGFGDEDMSAVARTVRNQAAVKQDKLQPEEQ